MLAEEHITAQAKTIAQGDDCLSGLFVEPVGRHARFLGGGHAADPLCGRFPKVSGFSGRSPDRREIRVTHVRLRTCIKLPERDPLRTRFKKSRARVEERGWLSCCSFSTYGKIV